jgi:ABC-type multidrug transport system ATPase subunit
VVQLWDLVRGLAEKGTTVVLATHNLHEAVAVGDVLAILHGGRLVAQRRLDTMGVAELRDVYFESTGEQDQIREMAVGGGR